MGFGPEAGMWLLRVSTLTSPTKKDFRNLCIVYFFSLYLKNSHLYTTEGRGRETIGWRKKTNGRKKQ